MSKKDEALKLALEALMEATKIHASSCKCSVCRAVIVAQDALAEQPAQQQEPVAIADGTFNHNCPIGTPLYTSPPNVPPARASKPWVGLTDVEWMNIVNKDHAWFGQRPEDVAHEVAKLVEAKLREKNA